MSEQIQEPEDSPEELEKWDQMMARLKKLAGMGPLKTVRDPKTGVTRNIPVDPKKVIREEYGKPGSKALAQGNFTTFINHYQGRRLAANLKLSFGTPDIIEISDPGVDQLVDYYNTQLTTDAQKRDFFLNVMSNDKRMIDLLNKLRIQFTIHRDKGQQPGLLERRQADGKDPDRTTVTDPRTLMALRKSFAKYPTAKSDIEAYMRDTIDQQADTDRDLEQQVATNRAQERNLDRLKDIARRQSQQLTKLGQENDQQEKELQDLEKQIAGISGTPEPAEPSPAEQPKAQTAAPVAARPVSAPAIAPATPAAQTQPTKPAAQKVKTLPGTAAPKQLPQQIQKPALPAPDGTGDEILQTIGPGQELLGRRADYVRPQSVQPGLFNETDISRIRDLAGLSVNK